MKSAVEDLLDRDPQVLNSVLADPVQRFGVLQDFAADCVMRSEDWLLSLKNDIEDRIAELRELHTTKERQSDAHRPYTGEILVHIYNIERMLLFPLQDSLKKRFGYITYAEYDELAHKNEFLDLMSDRAKEVLIKEMNELSAQRSARIEELERKIQELQDELNTIESSKPQL